ncbi:OmpA/MotB domain protein [Thioalkalivibrio sp. K90mix]|uniref:OmpA family protein n=1 Tax=Thioalkalivibrio sp. (strain K90mix) TaxID=396595 RepID=UPI000195A851|nr:OmpA family protein [Thioalkalivibrio sp. K90mix]ADC70869.1 OmpA/MotB domain protein [Thioalkalivibrio sp. K90mix]
MSVLRHVLPLFVGGLWLTHGVAQAGVVPHRESLERSDWQVIELDDACRIEQGVRHGGTLRFETQPGLALRAFWHAPYAMPEGATARLRTGAPEWLGASPKSPLDLEMRAERPDRFRVPDAQVQALKARLLVGHDVRIDFPGAEDAVHFRGIRFAQRAEAFEACYTGAEGPDVGALDRWSVYFATGSRELDSRGRETVARAAETLRTVERPRVRLVGLTDAEGPRELNERLSRQRAEAVRAALVEAGVPGDGLTVEAGGVDPEADGEREGSRRVDIWWLGGADAAAGPSSVAETATETEPQAVPESAPGVPGSAGW